MPGVKPRRPDSPTPAAERHSSSCPPRSPGRCSSPRWPRPPRSAGACRADELLAAADCHLDQVVADTRCAGTPETRAYLEKRRGVGTVVRPGRGTDARAHPARTARYWSPTASSAPRREIRGRGFWRLSWRAPPGEVLKTLAGSPQFKNTVPGRGGPREARKPPSAGRAGYARLLLPDAPVCPRRLGVIQEPLVKLVPGERGAVADDQG